MKFEIQVLVLSNTDSLLADFHLFATCSVVIDGCPVLL